MVSLQALGMGKPFTISYEQKLENKEAELSMLEAHFSRLETEVGQSGIITQRFPFNRPHFAYVGNYGAVLSQTSQFGVGMHTSAESKILLGGYTPLVGVTLYAEKKDNTGLIGLMIQCFDRDHGDALKETAKKHGLMRVENSSWNGRDIQNEDYLRVLQWQSRDE